MLNNSYLNTIVSIIVTFGLTLGDLASPELVELYLYIYNRRLNVSSLCRRIGASVPTLYARTLLVTVGNNIKKKNLLQLMEVILYGVHGQHVL